VLRVAHDERGRRTRAHNDLEALGPRGNGDERDRRESAQTVRAPDGHQYEHEHQHEGEYEPRAPGPYSYLSARIGSIRLALVAGIRPATAETTLRSATVPSAIDGS
jgi:hypothetical protein